MAELYDPTIEGLRAENERLRAALDEIVNPLAAMRRRADADGRVLSGMAYSISRDPNHLQDIARKALNHEQAKDGNQ
jgi:hypothetical protein